MGKGGVNNMANFIDSVRNILDLLGYPSTIIVFGGVVTGFIGWASGILPAILRLGNGFAKRKIVIFAKNDNSQSLIDLLLDSGLFLDKNIIRVCKEEDFGKAEEATLFLVNWPDWKEKVIDINNRKKDGEAMIVYAPKSGGFIPEDIMTKLDNGRNVTVTNFRGRLLNDVVTALITTGYTKK